MSPAGATSLFPMHVARVQLDAGRRTLPDGCLLREAYARAAWAPARTAQEHGRYLGRCLLATSAFDVVIQPTDDDTPGDAHSYEKPEEQSTGGERRLDGAMQAPMIRLNVRGCTAAHHPGNRCDRPLPWSKAGASHQDGHRLPHRVRQDRGTDADGTTKGDRQGAHSRPLGCRAHGVALPINGDANCDKWIQSS